MSTEEADAYCIVCLLFGRPVTLTLPAGPEEEEEDHPGDDDGEEGVERVARVPPSSSAPALEVAREQVLEGLDLLHATTDRASAQHQVRKRSALVPSRVDAACTAHSHARSPVCVTWQQAGGGRLMLPALVVGGSRPMGVELESVVAHVVAMASPQELERWGESGGERWC